VRVIQLMGVQIFVSTRSSPNLMDFPIYLLCEMVAGRHHLSDCNHSWIKVGTSIYRK